jgi:hypothetical protein
MAQIRKSDSQISEIQQIFIRENPRESGSSAFYLYGTKYSIPAVLQKRVKPGTICHVQFISARLARIGPGREGQAK